MMTVGKGKKWRLDLLSGHSAALVLLSVCFLLGSVFGCIGASLFRDEQGIVRQGMAAALSSLSQPQLWDCVCCAGLFCLCAFALGFTAFGTVGLPALFACRGFLLCYAVGVFYHLWGFPGLSAALILLALPALFWMPAFFALGAQGLPASWLLARRQHGKGKTLCICNRSFWPRCALCALLILLCSCVEYVCVPALMRMINGAFTLF